MFTLFPQIKHHWNSGRYDITRSKQSSSKAITFWTQKKKQILQKVVITDSFVEKNLKSLYSFIHLEYLKCVDLISSVTMNQYFSFILQFHSSSITCSMLPVTVATCWSPISAPGLSSGYVHTVDFLEVAPLGALHGMLVDPWGAFDPVDCPSLLLPQLL